ncbi:hypothetical protein E0Z10_g4522 [Xylaria hypoxylon]|uniref:Enoyl-CoA hydratase n=1 Tax=Xylaria hypoxylon TaxID=37992 RepID=A0A4Z0Z6M2_9PEZI|nr:hypothetical protein E0Z10_g4522 [Xylaria hypoxylon]
MSMSLPKLPARAAYLTLYQPRNRNTLTAQILSSIRQQLIKYNTPPGEIKPLFLPDFSRAVYQQSFGPTSKGGSAFEGEYSWLEDAEEWRKRRRDLPKVLVLRTRGPVFSAGHDLKYLEETDKSYQKFNRIFRRCADVISLIRQSPIPVVGVIQGLATGAGAQLALSTDLPVAIASVQFQLPGLSVEFPSTSPSTVPAKLGNAFIYRMLTLAEPVRADKLPAGAVETVPDMAALEKRVLEIVDKLVNRSSGQAQAQAMGKWAYWTQVGMGIQGDYKGIFEDDFAAAKAMAFLRRY